MTIELYPTVWGHVKEWFFSLPAFAQVVSSIAGAILGCVGVWKIMLSIWKWWITLRDNRILNILEENKRNIDIQRGGKNWVPAAIPLDQIALECKRSHVSTKKSLLRLEKKHKVYETKDGWKLGERPPSPKTFEELSASPTRLERWTPPWER